jgi:hypothetical protein
MKNTDTGNYSHLAPIGSRDMVKSEPEPEPDQDLGHRHGHGHHPELTNNNPKNPKPSPIALDQCRGLLLSVVLRNASLRDEFSALPSGQAGEKALALLNDTRVAEFMQKAKKVQAQMVSLNARNREIASSGDVVIPPDVNPRTDPKSSNGSNGAMSSARIHSDAMMVSPISHRPHTPTPTHTPTHATTPTSPTRPPPIAPKAMMHAETYRMKRKSLGTGSESPRKKWKVDNQDEGGHSTPYASHSAVSSGINHGDSEKVDSRNAHSHSSPPENPNCAVPGLWFAKVGLSGPDILEATFDIDPDTASRWQIGDESTGYVSSSRLFYDIYLSYIL